MSDRSLAQQISKKSTLTSLEQNQVHRSRPEQSQIELVHETCLAEWNEFQRKVFPSIDVINDSHVEMAARVLKVLELNKGISVNIDEKGKPDPMFLLYESFCLMGQNLQAGALQRFLNLKKSVQQEEPIGSLHGTMPPVPEKDSPIETARSPKQFVEVMARIGFRTAASIKFKHPETGREERQLIMFHVGKGILLNFETKDGEVSKGSFAYNWRANRRIDLSSWEGEGAIVAQGRFIAGYHDMKDHDSAKRIAGMILRMAGSGDFFPSWKSRPIGFYICNSADWEKIGRQNFDKANALFEKRIAKMDARVGGAVLVKEEKGPQPFGPVIRRTLDLNTDLWPK